MNCKEARKKLWDYYEGKLDGPTRAEMEEHIQTCAGCKKALEAIAAAHALIDEERMKLPAPLFVQRTMDRVRMRKAQGPGAFWFDFHGWAGKAAAAAAILLGATAGIVAGLPDRIANDGASIDAFANAYGLQTDEDNILEELKR